MEEGAGAGRQALRPGWGSGPVDAERVGTRKGHHMVTWYDVSPAGAMARPPRMARRAQVIMPEG